MSYDFDNALEDANKQYPSSKGGNFDSFNIEEGNGNVCRVLTKGAPYGNHFMGKGVKSPVCYGYEKGCPVREKDDDGNLTNSHADTSVKFIAYVLDRKDGKVKSAFFPYSVIKQIGALQKNPDYKFDDLPMPYDIRITFKKEASPNEKYRVEFKPNSPELTENDNNELEKQMSNKTPEEIVERMKSKQMEEDERNGRKLSPEEVQANSAKYLQDAAAGAQPSAPDEDAIQYPEETINPEDIPF